MPVIKYVVTMTQVVADRIRFEKLWDDREIFSFFFACELVFSIDYL